MTTSDCCFFFIILYHRLGAERGSSNGQLGVLHSHVLTRNMLSQEGSIERTLSGYCCCFIVQSQAGAERTGDLAKIFISCDSAWPCCCVNIGKSNTGFALLWRTLQFSSRSQSPKASESCMGQSLSKHAGVHTHYKQGLAKASVLTSGERWG